MNNYSEIKSATQGLKKTYKTGTIVSIMQDKNNFIHAIIRGDPEYSPDPSWTDDFLFNDFNVGAYQSKKPLALLFIPVVNLINSKYEDLDSFVGMSVRVKFVNDIAVEAQVIPKAFLTYTEKMTIRDIVDSGGGMEYDSKKFQELIDYYLGLSLDDIGYMEIKDDKGKYPEVVVTSDHATTDQILKTEAEDKKRSVIKPTSKLKGNSLLKKLKTALCHTPSTFLTGK